MKLTIVPIDKTVIVNGTAVALKDSFPSSVPSEVHALQWAEQSGSVEKTDETQDSLSTLPAWASDCVAAHEQAIIEIEANEPSTPTSEQEARSDRAMFLEETDWTANSDVTMSTEMTVYRQALRDITDQVGFPDNITWPTKP